MQKLEIRVGIRNNPSVISFESSESAAAIKDQLTSALNSGEKVVSLKDDKGREIVIVVEAITHIEIGADQPRKVGFIN